MPCFYAGVSPSIYSVPRGKYQVSTGIIASIYAASYIALSLKSLRKVSVLIHVIFNGHLPAAAHHRIAAYRDILLELLKLKSKEDRRVLFLFIEILSR